MLLATTVHLARYLMAQHPVSAEWGNASTTLLADARRGPGMRRIIEVAWPDDPLGEHKYLVIDGLEARTTTEPPSWQDEVERERIVLEDRPTTLLAEMRRRHGLFAQGGGVSAFPMPLATLEGYYDDRPRLCGDVFDFLPLDQAELAAVLASSSATHRWCEQTIDAVRKTHLSLHAAGVDAASVFSVLMILLASSDADKLLALGTAGAIRSDDETTARLLANPTSAVSVLGEIAAGGPLRIVPVAQPLYYLSRFGSYDVEIFDSAMAAAQEMIRLGDQDRDELKHAHSIEMHYLGLDAALCWYLAADQVLGAVETIFVDVAPREPRLERIREERVICEERRAVLITALHAAAGLNAGIPDLWHCAQLWGFLHDLRAAPVPAARAHLRDHVLKLLLPRFLYEMATGWLEVAHAETIDQGLSRLNRLAGVLEHALPQTIGLRVEPNYLQVTYDCLIDGHTRAKAGSEKARIQRLRDELPSRVAALSEAGDKPARSRQATGP